MAEWGYFPPPAKKRGWVGPAVLVGVIVVLVTGLLVFLGGPGQSRPPSNIVGYYDRWEPVDDSRGYIYFRVENKGSASATAECAVEVRDDFGNRGFDVMVGESLAPAEVKSLRMALNVSGHAAYLVRSGAVKNC